MLSTFLPRRTKPLAILAAVVLAGGGVLFAYAAFFGAPQGNADPERFIVPQGAALSDVARALKDAGFIRNAGAFALVHPKGIEPGGYRLEKDMNVFAVSRALSGVPYMKWVTIPEGLRKEETAVILAAALGWSAGEKEKWITTDTAAQPDYAEGVYFPDTYLIPVDEQPPAVADRLRAKFNEKFAPLAPEAAAQNIKWTTAVKIASIVQREAAGTEDMPLIAGILWNRLLTGMKLEVDATLQYARGDTGSGWWAPISVLDKRIDSPYNTYLFKGLPPHPIANPGLDAIRAVLHPAETKCLFYLHDAARAIHCAVTYAEHRANIDAYLR